MMTNISEVPCDCEVSECKGSRLMYCIDDRRQGAAQTQGADGAGTKTAGRDAVSELEWLRGQVIGLCEHTEDNAGAELEKPGLTDHERGFHKGAYTEAKGIRRAIAEAVRCLLKDLEGDAPAPAATPGVPDSLRGLRPEDLTDAYRRIDAQPAGQAGDAGAVKPDPIRLMKETLFACLAEGTHDRNYGGVLVAGGKKAWLRFSVVDAETSAALAAGKTTPNSTRTGAAETEENWKCPECGCSWFARIDERKPGGEFGPGPNVRCNECKRVRHLPPLAARPEAPSDADAGAVDELSTLHSRTERGDSRRYGSCSDSKCGHERWCQNIYACKATFGAAPSGQAEG